MNPSDIVNRNGRYVLKFPDAESYYKNSLLLECIQHYKYLMKGKLLDLGCGNKPYSVIYNKTCQSSIGCDVPFSLHQNSNVEISCYAEDIDKHFEKNFFDSMICTEVLEHTVNDRKVVENINKLLKLKGIVIISAPFIYVLHEAPHDYRRYTLYGLKTMLEENNFEIKSIFSMGGTFSAGFFIYYYSLTKVFFYFFKQIGLKNLQQNRLMKALISFPELLWSKLYIPFFRKKLASNKYPSTNEMFSSLGYFIIAEKINDVII